MSFDSRHLMIECYENNRKRQHWRMMGAPREQVLAFWCWVHEFRTFMQPKEERATTCPAKNTTGCSM